MSLRFVQQIFYWLCYFPSPKCIHFWKRHYSSRQVYWIKEHSYLRQWGLFPEYFLKLFSFDVSLDLALWYWSTLRENARLWLTSSLQLTLMEMSRTKKNKYKRERKHCERSTLSRAEEQGEKMNTKPNLTALECCFDQFCKQSHCRQLKDSIRFCHPGLIVLAEFWYIWKRRMNHKEEKERKENTKWFVQVHTTHENKGTDC